jgi:hypothetical protein
MCSVLNGAFGVVVVGVSLHRGPTCRVVCSKNAFFLTKYTGGFKIQPPNLTHFLYPINMPTEKFSKEV